MFSRPIITYAGPNYCRMLQESILQYFRPSLSLHLSSRTLFCLFLSGPFKTGFTVYAVCMHGSVFVLNKLENGITCKLLKPPTS